MIDCTQFIHSLLEEFKKTPGTASVQIRCSLPAEELTLGILNTIFSQVDEVLRPQDLKVDSVIFSDESPDSGSKDFFIRVSVMK